MPWDNTPAKRQRDSQVYDAEYRRNAAICKRRANGWCADCHHRHQHLEADHIIPVTQGGTHALSNLQALCRGQGTCDCHGRKSAREGNAGHATRQPPDPSPRPATRW